MDNETPSKQEEQKVQNNEIYIYLLITDKSGNQFLKPVLRTLPPKEEPLYFAINQLIQGPNAEEQKQGAYTEIPKDTKILGIVSKENSVIIDLSNTFQFGGGSDSTYARVRQLIKTVLANTNKPAYLYIEGKKADIIGGEGITLTQPLSEKSLDE